MKNYKIILQYDGSRYKGWQTQKNTDMTIQGKLEAVLERMAGHPVEIHGSGRTDAGCVRWHRRRILNWKSILTKRRSLPI